MVERRTIYSPPMAQRVPDFLGPEVAGSIPAFPPQLWGKRGSFYITLIITSRPFLLS
jgi:hypothetical protein